MAKSAVAQMDDKSVGGKLKSFPARGKSFLTDVRTELRHVTTPSRKEVQATTVVVVIVGMIVTATIVTAIETMVIKTLASRAIATV